MKKGFFSSSSASKTTAAAPAPPTLSHSSLAISTRRVHPTPLPSGILSQPQPGGLRWSFPHETCALCLTTLSARLFSQTPFASSNTPLPSLSSPPFALSDIPGRGKGLVATRDIPAGTVIFHDRPILVYDPARAPHRTQLESLLLDAISRLNPDTQAAFLSLFNAFAGDSLLGIVETNQYQLVHLEGAETAYSGVFPTFSRLNHSCNPNVMPEWDSASFSVGVRTVRPVRKGDELLVTYIVPFQKRRERREELLVKVRPCVFREKLELIPVSFAVEVRVSMRVVQLERGGERREGQGAGADGKGLVEINAVVALDFGSTQGLGTSLPNV